ncbi:CHAP domain-containing protein, partial [candidate division KSB1 bacterium]
NLGRKGYNFGLKWQCVEFVKRYYSNYLHHNMPNSYGHAKDFFIKGLSKGNINKERNLKQYSNKEKTKPSVNDIIVFDGWSRNRYGHIAIVSEVKNKQIEIIQQNVGKRSRQKLKLKKKRDYWSIKDSRVLGWLRKEN